MSNCAQDQEHASGFWNFLFNASREHFFTIADKRSLCGSWQCFTLPAQDKTFGKPECKACRKKLESLKLKESP